MTRAPSCGDGEAARHIPTDAVATIGDMQNDLPMFAKSGVSFAMGNATEGIKRQATHVTGSNEHDGFAAAIETVLKLARDVRRLSRHHPRIKPA